VDELTPFRDAVLAAPWDLGPRLVWADRLDELGDRRGAWLRHWCALEEAALAIPPPWPDASPNTSWQRVLEAVHGFPGNLPLLAVVLASLTPTPDGRRARNLLSDERVTRALATAGLVACGLVSRAGLSDALREARAAKLAVFESSAYFESSARVLSNPYLYWAVAAAVRSADAELATTEPATAIRRLMEALAWGVNGWLILCCQALATIPVPPHWGTE
jgi:uncharacterized protein (TIGR02996 family)